MATPAKSKTETLQLIAPISGIRLDKYVAEALPKFSRSYIQKLIAQGHILVNEQKAKPSQRLKDTDKITIKPPPPTYPTAEPIPLAIIYEDIEAESSSIPLRQSRMKVNILWNENPVEFSISERTKGWFSLESQQERQSCFQ